MQSSRLKRPIKQSIASALTVPVLAGLLAACGEPTKAPVPAASTPVQKQAIATAPTKTAEKTGDEAVAVYSYSANGRRDPFAPIIVPEAKKGPAMDRPPLERYNITEFKLSGIVWGGFGYNAILEGPDGKGYFVHVGTVVGPNRGVVKKITPNTVIVEEKYKTYTGETERRETVVELRKTQEAMP
jgi:type IV pilus assembly protein PilP